MLAAATAKMDAARDDLLTGAVFAQQQYREVGVGNAAHRVADRLYCRRLSHKQRVLRRLLDKLFVPVQQLVELLGVFQRDGGMRCQLHEAALVVGGELALMLVDELKRAN